MFHTYQYACANDNKFIMNGCTWTAVCQVICRRMCECMWERKEREREGERERVREREGERVMTRRKFVKRGRDELCRSVRV